MNEEIKKETQDVELDLEGLDKVRGGSEEMLDLIHWMEARPDIANEAKRIRDTQGKAAGKTYVLKLIDEYQLPDEWRPYALWAVCGLM